MIKFRLANGIYKNVAPEHLDIFKERHPDAVEIGGGIPSVDVKPKSDNTFWNTVKNLGMTTASLTSPITMTPTLVAGEVKKAKGEDEPVLNTIARIGGEYAESLYVGFKTGTVMEEYLEVQKGNQSTEAIEAMIKAGDMLNKLPQNDRMIKFAQKVEEAGGGFWNGLWLMAKEDKILASQVAVQSLAMMATGATWEAIEELAEGNQPDVLKHMIGGAGVGAALYAGTGAAAGAALTAWSGPGAAIGATAGGILSGTTGAIAGGLGGLSLAMEKGLVFVELLKEEIEASGLEYNKENIRRFLEDDEKYLDIKNKAIKRGLTIGTIDMLSGGLAGAATVKTGKILAKTAVIGSKGTKVAAIGAGTTVEGISGGVGEFFGQKAAGQEYDAAEIILEAFAETPGALVTSVPKAVIQDKAVYSMIENDVKINYTKKEFLDKIEGLSDESIALLNLEVNNDYALAEELFNRQNDFIIRSQIDPRVNNEADIKNLVGLEKQRQKAEADTKKKGVSAAPNAKEKLLSIESQIEEIINKYEGVDRRTKDVRVRKEKAAEVRKVVRESTLKETIEFAKKGGKIIGKDVIVADNDTDAQTLHDKALKEWNTSNPDNQIKAADVIGADGFIVGDTIIINKEVAGKTGQINVGAHELLHGVVAKHMQGLSVEGQTSLISDFKNTLTKEQRGYIETEINRRIKAGEDLNINTTEEWLTVFSDGLTKGDITFNEGVFDKLKNVFQEILKKFGVNKEFANGRQVYNFMKDYQKSIKTGKLSKRAIKLAGKGVAVTGTKLSKTSPRAQQFLDAEIDNESLVDIEQSPQSTQEDKFGAVEAIIERNWPVISKALKFDPTGNIPIQAVKEAVNEQMLGIFPQVTLPDGTRISRNKPLFDTYNKENKVTTFLDATLRNRQPEIYTRAKAIGGTEQMGVDISEAKDIKAPTPTKPKPSKKARKIKSLSDVTLDNKDLISKDILNILDILVKADAVNLEQQLEETIKPIITKEVKKQMGAITKKVPGFASEEYKAYHALNYENHVKALDVKTIKKNYKTLFEITKTRREKDKRVDPVTGKVTYPGKGIYNIETNKAKFTKHFIDGGYTTLLARQKKLAEFIVDSFTEKAVNDYIIKNSNNINKVVKAELNNYLNNLDKQKAENRTFDTVKYSRTNNQDGVMELVEVAMESEFDTLEELFQSSEWNEIVDIRELDPIMVDLAKETIGKNNAINSKETTGFRKNKIVQEVLDKLPQEQQDEFNANGLNKNHPSSITRLTDFTSKLAATMDPRLVLDGLYEDMFGFTHRYADKLRIGKEAFNKVMDSAKKRISDSKFIEKYGFDPTTVKKYMYNSSIGIMSRINTVLKKAFPTAKEKFDAIKGKEGKNIEQANKQNHKVLEYIIKKAINVVSKSPKQMLGVLRWLESATSAVKGLRALTGLTHMDVMAESQEPSTKHPDYKDAYKTALESIRKRVKSKSKKNKEYNKLNDGSKKSKAKIREYAKARALAELKVKGEHLKPSANLMAQFARLIWKYSKLDMTNTKVLSEFKSEFNKLVEGYDQALGNKNTFFIVDKAMGSQAEGEVRLITGLKNTGRTRRFYHLQSGVQSYGYIARTVVHTKAFKKLSDKVDKITKFSKSVNFSRSSKNPTKGITVLDFDDTLATTKSLVRFTTPDGTKGTLNAEEYASTYQDLLEQGYKFDFTEFDKVVKAKLAPLFNKALKLQSKFGPENMFILTARPPAAQKAIYDFLKANGLNIPLKNITALGISTAEAKALWVADKVSEGYNDFYFADDALQNTQAVQNMLDQFDVKSKVQQAKVKFSKSINTEFNNILEDVTGIESKKRFSAIKARKRGASKGKFRFFIPPSHEDFVGLLYNFMGKGRKGDAHRNFFEKALVRPLNRAYRELNTAKQAIANDYKSLNKEFTNVKKKLTKKTPDGDFTYQDAIRVYLFDKHGHKVPGLTKTDQQKLVDLVMEDTELQTYAETLNVISKQDTYVKPSETWETGDIRVDLDDATGRIGRASYFTEFNENAEIIFSEENLNKIEAAYGTNMVSAIKDILYRTKTGRNRPSGQNKLVNGFMNYLNGSVASTMFFNMRSAVLQQMSMVNFINFADNNVFTAAKAFANQPQYWKDWTTIFNSDFMKQRRGGIKTDVNGAELAASLRGAKNTPRALLAKLLQLGFLPTQIGDNMAIATGGSTFYRNRINTYLKQGLNQKEAESKAWIDFQTLAEATQQSARPDMVSQQQASPLGKVILAFQNVTSQFNRLGKKAFLDIKNRRITPGNTTQFQSDVSNMSRIGYYFAIQNLIFYSLQSALFLALFEDDEDDDKWLKKKERVVNGSIDSVLRGTGVWGAVVATAKNMAIKWHEQREKGYNADESSVLMEMLNVSPPLGIKARKMVNAEKTLNYNKKVIDEMETFDIDNPMWSAVTNYIEATTNIPTNRLYNKTQNVRQSLNNQHEAYQRALMFGGWSQWNLDVENEKMEKIKEKTKKSKKKKKKEFITY